MAKSWTNLSFQMPVAERQLLEGTDLQAGRGALARMRKTDREPHFGSDDRPGKIHRPVNRLPKRSSVPRPQRNEKASARFGEAIGQHIIAIEQVASPDPDSQPIGDIVINPKRGRYIAAGVVIRG